MAASQNSFSELIQNFIILQNNAFLIMQKISESVTSDAESISFDVKDVSGTTISYTLPSYKYMKSFMNRIDETLKTMIGLNDTGESLVCNADGTYSKIYQSRISAEPLKISTVDVPMFFNIKPNWFFENFLNPMMYITIDISKYVPQSADRIMTKRIILNTDSTEKVDAFEQGIKGRNDITLNELLSLLKTYGIDYVDDEDIRDLPLSVLKFNGKFDVIDIRDINTTNSQGVVGTQRRYFLNKITYSDNTSKIADTLTLSIGDKLLVRNSLYEVINVDSSTNSVALKNVSGYDPISIGADVLSYYSDAYAAKQADIGVGFNERQVIFFKSIDDNSNILSSEWSNGISFYTNDLKITTETGEMSFSEYYQKYVIDFGKILIGSSKERQISAIYGEVPNTPILIGDNLNVLQINKHLFDTKELDTIKKKGAEKIKLSSEITQLEKAIDEKKQILGSKNYKTDTERRAAQNELESLVRNKTSKSSLYASIIAELNAITTEDPSSLDKPKYRVRGFFDIPRPAFNAETGEQHIVQFEYAYRYMKKDGAPSEAQQIAFNGTNNQVKSGVFSPWNFVKSPIRKKYYDSESNTYKWRTEDIQDPEVENINQIDVPITPGELVEIKVRAISEAGWPLNPILSPWSTVITKEFPTELLKNDESQVVLESAKAEDTRVKFQQQLSSMGADLHLASSMQTGEKYWPHNADVINSGFFDTNGIILSLYEKLKQQDILLKQLQEQLNKVGPTLDVKLIDETGNVVSVQNGGTINLFGGYYKEEIEKIAESQRKGAIITKKYIIQISNVGGSALELVSRFPGGLGEDMVDTRNTSQAFITMSPDQYDYYAKRKYDMVPLNHVSINNDEITNGKKIRSANHQSAQVLSQFLYLRYKDVGLATDLYFDTEDNSRCYTPTSANHQTDNPSWVWNRVAAGAAPTGNGYISSFCVHMDCPILSGPSEWWDGETAQTVSYETVFQKPILGTNSSLKTSAFKHAANFNATMPSSIGNKQLAFKQVATSETGGRYTEAYMYPDKLGFYDHDRYLIGTQTCGSYLYMGPVSFNQLLVDGTDFRAKREVEAKDSAAIQIPIYFQFRMVDYYGTTNTSGKLGGYNPDGPSANSNLTYEKRLGIDLYVLDKTPFSFDVKVSAKYNKNSATEKTVTTPTATYSASSLNLNRNLLGTL